jgi:FtsZ-binding cell division protein ZapB
MAKDDGSALRDEIQELKEEAAALTDRAKKTARQAEVLSERIKHLQTQIAKKPERRTTKAGNSGARVKTIIRRQRSSRLHPHRSPKTGSKADPAWYEPVFKRYVHN